MILERVLTVCTTILVHAKRTMGTYDEPRLRMSTTCQPEIKHIFGLELADTYSDICSFIAITF